MMYEYMTMNDNTGIAHSEMKPDGTVKVYIEKPIQGGFKHITCFLPEYKWEDCEGFDESELESIRKTIENNAHLIMEFAKDGGFENASGL